MTDTHKQERIEFSGTVIRQLRKERRLSRADIQELHGIPAPTFKAWERGDRTPSDDGLEKLNELFGLDFYRPK